MPTAPDIFWVRYEPRQSFHRLLGLSPAAELAHRRFSDFVWAGDGWPSADPAAAAGLARVSPRAWPRVLSELRRAGWSCRRTILYHPQVAAVHQEARAASRSCRARGAQGGRASWQARKQALAESQPGSTPASPRLDTVTVQSQHSTITLPTAERSTRSVAPRKKGAGGETEFMHELKETITLFSPDAAELEHTNWGGWWRNRYRESADKARRVLAEVRVMIKEGTIRKTPGAAATDLWNRLP